MVYELPNLTLLQTSTGMLLWQEIMTTIDVSGIEEWMIKQTDWSCVWTDADMIDSSLLPMVTKSCMKGLFKWSNGKFMPKTYFTDTDAMTVMTRAAQYIPALAEIMMRSKFAVTDKPLTRGELLTRLQGIMISIQASVTPVQPEVDFIQAQKDLDAARTLRDSKKLTTYSLIQTRSCFCMENYTRAMMYNVANGVINTWSLVYADNGAKVTIETQLNTVDQAFDMIQEAIDNKVANLTVEYNTITGYPISIAIDRDFMIADEEMYYSFKLITDADVVLSWSYILDTYNGAKVDNSAITLSFAADRVSAKMCNGMGANYTATKNTISFWPMMSTMMYCDDTQLMDLESQFGWLSTTSYTTTTTSLTMTASGSTWIWTKK
jgi:heat shock protein HslJ